MGLVQTITLKAGEIQSLRGDGRRSEAKRRKFYWARFYEIPFVRPFSLFFPALLFRLPLIPLTFSISPPCGKVRDADECHLVLWNRLGRDGT